MAKKPTNAATQRLGCTFDAQTYELISALALMRNCETPAAAITEAVWAYVGTLENKQREAILTVVRAKTGRLKRSCGAVTGETDPDQTGQGTDAVIDRISDIHRKSVAPVDAALNSLVISRTQGSRFAPTAAESIT